MVDRITSCGVLVIGPDSRLLLGQTTGSRRWDIPKGLAEPGESARAAACRELHEETGLEAPPDALHPLGIHRYLPRKDLALFRWRIPAAPDPATLRCRSTVTLPSGRVVPELARFAWLAWDEALARIGRNLARVLTGLGPHPR